MQLRSVYTELTRRLINKEEILHVRALHPDGRLVDGFVPKEGTYCYIFEDEILNHNNHCIIQNNNLPTILFHQFKPEERVDSFEDRTLKGNKRVVVFRNSSGYVVVDRKLLNKFKPDDYDGLTYTMFPKAHLLYIYDSESKNQVGSIMGISISEVNLHA